MSWEIDSTTVEEGVVRIEAYVASYDVYFELNIDGEDISGSLMGMFDVEGIRVETLGKLHYRGEEENTGSAKQYYPMRVMGRIGRAW